ncbi:hypothetical protein EV122DRAFT_206846 [Schizophyllum commune]
MQDAPIVPDPADPSNERRIPVDPAGDLFGDYDDNYTMDEFPGLYDDDLDAQPQASGDRVFDDDSELDPDFELEADVELEDEIDAYNAELEGGAEPERDFMGYDERNSDGDDDFGADPDRDQAEDGLRRPPVVERYAGAGRVYDDEVDSSHDDYAKKLGDSFDNIYGVFGHRLAWEVAQWAKVRGPSSTAFTELMQIDGVVEALDLPFRNTAELDKLIDKHLPGRPPFERHEVSVAGQIFDVYYRDILACVRALLGDVDFCPVLMFCPERHYMDETRQQRLYHDMNTGKWWWDTQRVEARPECKGATIIPIIFSSDKTQLTLFRNKSAYPLYMTIGNIPKEIRRKPSSRAYVLLAYLPTSGLKHIPTLASRRRCLANLFHSCLKRITAPLKGPGVYGERMATADGKVRSCHPIFACDVCDYPEQVLVTCTINGDCSLCGATHNELGVFDRDVADGNKNALRELDKVMEVLNSADQDGWYARCKSSRVRPVREPFWSDLPFAHPHRSITPDVLHQLYQGVVKHLLAWLVDAYGAAELDARCRRLPPNHNIRIFMSGISSLTHVTGQTHDEICSELLGLIIGAPVHLPDGVAVPRAGPRIVAAVRGILDFVYLTQFPVHSSESLVLIKLFGTTDNYNTQYTERLHIDYAKRAYAATNRKNELPQMTTWLERRERVARFGQYVRWRLAGSPALASSARWSPPGLELDRMQELAKHPTRSATLTELERDYGAQFIRPALSRYITIKNNPSLNTARQVEDIAEHVYLPFDKVAVRHRVKYTRRDPWTDVKTTVDSVHVHPARRDKQGRQIPARFDTGLFDLNDGLAMDTGVQGHRVGRVRAIFSLSKVAVRYAFNPGVVVPRHLAYVEWYTPFSRRPERDHRMYKVSTNDAVGGGHLASIVPISQLRRSVHLFPKFGRVAPPEWTSSNVLDHCKTFFHFLMNSFTDKHLYRILY